MATGQELIQAINGNGTLRSVQECPQVSVQMGFAVYDELQNDDDDIETVITANDLGDLPDLVYVGPNRQNQTAVWHARLDPVHHFVIVPWYNQMGTPQQYYAVYMAYESYNSQGAFNGYNMGAYIGRTGRAPHNHAFGFNPNRHINNLITMFSSLLEEGPDAWGRYFGNVPLRNAQRITLYKYPWENLNNTLLHRVGAYNG